MIAKEYLKQYEYADRKVKSLVNEYKELSQMVDAIRSTSDNDGMPHGSGISKPTESKAIALSDKHARLMKASLEALEKREEIFEFINGIDGIEGTVLYERYINLRSWEDISIRLHYSWPGIHKVHQRALAIAGDKLNEISKE